MVADVASQPVRHRGHGVIRGLVEVPIIAVLAVLIVIVLRAVLVQPFYIPSASMVPQLRINDKILVSRLSYRFHQPRRGDIAVFDEPPGTQVQGGQHHGGAVRFVTERLGLVPRTDELVKRVIALPGEQVEGKGGHVYVDGRLLLEPYLPPGVRTEPFPARLVPAGMLWVMGDNRDDSEDSRIFGPIRGRTVVGRAVVRVWPLDAVAFL